MGLSLPSPSAHEVTDSARTQPVPQVVPPKDYMRHAFEHVRKAGGVCVVDEVQVGCTYSRL